MGLTIQKLDVIGFSQSRTHVAIFQKEIFLELDGVGNSPWPDLFPEELCLQSTGLVDAGSVGL